MKKLLFSYKFLFIFSIIQFISCSNQNDNNNSSLDIDTDNDGIIDSEDIDDDNDGLIEVFNLSQLNALLRSDLTTFGKKSKNKTDFIGFELMKDLDFEDINDYEDSSEMTSFTTGLGWEPIGTDDFSLNNNNIETRFGSVFEGNSHTIKNLYINRPNESFVGLFGACSNSAQIKNLNIELKSVIANSRVGGLTGVGQGLIDNCKVTGTIKSATGGGQTNMGLLVGVFEGGTISNCSTFGKADGIEGRITGGLLGRLVINPETNDSARIISCYSEAEVIGESMVGGLVGSFSLEDAINAKIEVENSYATGNVTGENQVGGLIGSSLGSKITSCYATGDITNTGNSEFDGDSGGLIGWSFRANLTSCYATGDILGNSIGECIGGLIGFIHSTTVNTCYSTGRAEGDFNEKGGLTGRCAAGVPSTILNNNYWDTSTSGFMFSRGDALGKTTSELQTPTTITGIFSQWNIEQWDFGTSLQYPVLKNMPNGMEIQR